MRRANLNAPEFDLTSERDRFRWRCARIGKQLGSDRIGVSVYELGDGQSTYPYHFHYGVEEWLVVIAGTPTLRGPDGERELRAGDAVCFPAGPEGAHAVRGPGRVLLLSANRVPDVAGYPDSGKVTSIPHGKVFREADAVGYWDGE